MPSISNQLKELGVQVGTSNLPRPPKSKSNSKLIDVFDGSWEETQQGDCFVVRKSLSLNQDHDSFPLAKFPDLSVFSAMPGLDGIAKISMENILFIDTETTGLSGGAGTYVFLIGAAKYHKKGLHFAQFFLQDPAEELSQLSALENFVSSSDLIVSYNGKSFDVPRIKTRFSFHGRRSPFDSMRHIDLLHIARRLWKRHLPGCKLGDLEHHILGLKRSSLDIPGWQVSEKFFDYLQTGDPEPLKGVFYHNEMDVISLVSLLSYITERLTNPLSPVYQDRNDLISIGEYLVRLRQENQAIPVLTQALVNKDTPDEIRISGLLSLANLYKRSGKLDFAIPLWEECADLKDPRPHIELAKYYEHKIFDFQEAIHWTLTAIEIYQISTSEFQTSISLAKAEHRLARLKRKSENQK